MDTTLVGAAVASLVVGFIFGRATAGRDHRTTVVYQPPRAGATPLPDAGGDAEIETHLRSGQKILAIKRYRELHGTGLKEAKDAVEALEARLGAGH